MRRNHIVLTVAGSFHQFIMVLFVSVSAAEGGVDLSEVGQRQLHLPAVVGAPLDGVPLEVHRGELSVRLELFHLVPVGNLKENTIETLYCIRA